MATMPQPERYLPSFAFTNWSAQYPLKPQPGVSLDAQFSAIQVTTDELIANLGKIQRDDGNLANNTVGREQLKSDITLGFNAPTPWAPNTVYTALDTVFYDDIFWRALTQHTSGDTFDETLWEVIADFTAATTEAQAAAALAQEWAEKTDGPVETGPDQYSAKWWATSPNVQTIATNIVAIETVATNIQAIIDAPGNVSDAKMYADLAEEWAEKMDGPVETGPDQYSAKYWADQAHTAFQTNNWSTGGGTWDGVSTDVTLPEDPVVAERVLFVEAGAPKRPGVDYTIAGTTLHRTTTPPNGTAYFWVIFGSAEFRAVSDGGVSTPAKLADGVVTEPKLADDSVATRAIVAGAVTKTELAASSVDATKIDQTALKALRDLLIPVGIVWDFGLPESAIPAGWVAAAGQQITTTYPVLRQALIDAGSPYGSVGGHPLAPDYRGRLGAGKDNMGGVAANRLTNSGLGTSGINGVVLGAAGGADRHQLTQGQGPRHQHGGTTNVAGNHQHNYQHKTNSTNTTATGGGLPFTYVTTGNETFQTELAGDHQHGITTDFQGGDEAHPNVQPTLVVNKIMKAH
jgi:microcystin-dependent protein